MKKRELETLTKKENSHPRSKKLRVKCEKIFEEEQNFESDLKRSYI